MATSSISHLAFSMKTPTSSSSSLATSMKLKTLLHNFIFSHLCRIARAITKAKSILIELIKETHINLKFLELPMIMSKKNKSKRNIDKLFLGSFRFHYNWCTSSSHVVPLSLPGDRHVYYDSTWNTVIGSCYEEYEDDGDMAADDSSQLSGYLGWLEGRKVLNNGSSSTCSSKRHQQQEMNEIDQLADKFIANCHEKFLLEKQDSYRRFQEMMARSV